jgi:hypothetical protein
VAAVCISCACSVMVEMPAWEITLLYPRSFHFLYRVETSEQGAKISTEDDKFLLSS